MDFQPLLKELWPQVPLCVPWDSAIRHICLLIVGCLCSFCTYINLETPLRLKKIKTWDFTFFCSPQNLIVVCTVRDLEQQ